MLEKKIAEISFIFALFLASFFVFVEVLGETRIHYKVFLENGEEIEYSEIYSSPSENNVQNVALFELQEKGEWVVEQKILQVDNGTNIATFKLLSTGEFLQITIIGINLENNNPKIILNANDMKSLNLTFGDVPKKSTNFIAFISDNFSKEFVEGLDKLRKINSEIYSPPIPDTYFMTIWSWEMIEQAVVLKQMCNKANRLKMNVDCDFDAKFGYPCHSEKIPVKKSKVPLIEKKQ